MRPTVIQNPRSVVLAGAATFLASLLAGSAAAQAPAQVQAQGAATAQAPATPQAGAPPAGAPGVSSDHDLWIGRIGIGWFGVSNVPIANASPGGTRDDPDLIMGSPFVVNVPTPAIGVRYWMSPRLGLDVGIGAMVVSGEIRVANRTFDRSPVTALLAHFGLPIVMATGEHVAMLVIPEVNAGRATSSVSSPDPGGPPPAELIGFRLDVGARAGAEVHFGFIDIPQLSLEGSVGAFLTRRTAEANVAADDAFDRAWLITTSAFDNPWDFFRSNVAARYYF